MWESPVYKFEKDESYDDRNKIIRKDFEINVTFSIPRREDDPGKALKGVFNKITKNLKPENTNILDVGAGKLRNTLWLLEKGFNVWAVEFPELKKRLKDAEEKWKKAEKYENFHKIIFPKDFIKLNKSFDIILLINEINVMPIPLERFAMLRLCRKKIKDKGILLWHQWRGKSTNPQKYNNENEFLDGHLMGRGSNHTFYVEHNKEETREMLYSVGFEYDENIYLRKVPSNSGFSYIFRPSKKPVIIEEALDLDNMLKKKHNTKKIIKNVKLVKTLDLYIKQLKLLKKGKDSAKVYHILASRIFFEIFKKLIGVPIIEKIIDEGGGSIDIVYKNKNKEGIFKNLKDMRNIICPNIIVECKNYNIKLTKNAYSQLSGRLTPNRGLLGFLLCRNKHNEAEIIKNCRAKYNETNIDKKHVIVLDDNDLIKLSDFKSKDDESRIYEFIENRIDEITS